MASEEKHGIEETLEVEVVRLRRERAELQRRLDFVEELVGPTEAQRKELHELVLEARQAAVQAHHLGCGVPIKVAGRLDEELILRKGLSEKDVGLLQGGCLPDNDEFLLDVSLLGDPSFCPYDEQTGEPKWDSKGGVLQMSLEEVKDRFGQTVAHDVVRCARELDTYDASRRVGVELPWDHEKDRELKPAEVIGLVAELGLRKQPSIPLLRRSAPDPHRNPSLVVGGNGDVLPLTEEDRVSPYAVSHAPPRRSRPMAQVSRGRSHAYTANSGVLRSARSRGQGGAASGGASSPVGTTILPRIGPGRASVAVASAGSPSSPSHYSSSLQVRCHPGRGSHRHSRVPHDVLNHSVVSCHGRGLRLF